MRRAAIAVLAIPLVTSLIVLGGVQALAVEDDRPIARLARPTWDTGWFQAEILRQLLGRLGFQVEGPTTMRVDEFYAAVAAGEVDLWVSGWFPLHDSEISPHDPVERVGTAVNDGALQGYFADKATAELHGITSLGDLADPDVAALFDTDGDGRAELVGCNADWACAARIDAHLEIFGLTETVEHVKGDYSPLIRETIKRYDEGEPILYYTWTPNWTAGRLVPGRDVAWLELPPSSSLSAEDASSYPDVFVSGLRGCANDPCRTGWLPNDISIVANTDFLDAHPSVRKLSEQVTISLDDISDQNSRMISHGGDPHDISGHAAQWLTSNSAAVSEWIMIADPDAVGFEETSPQHRDAAGTLAVAAHLEEPFVIYDDGVYGGFEVELAHLIASRLGMELQIHAVDTVAKQLDDISRGEARLGLGGVAMTGSREAEIDFSLPVLNSGLTILAPNEDQKGFIGSALSPDRVLSFARAVTSSAWLIVLFGVAVLIAAHLIWWLERKHNPDFAAKYRNGIWDSFYWSVVTMSTVGYGDKVARGTRGRLLALVWIALGTLLFASFSAAIASSLVESELRSDISSPSDLRGKRVASVEHSSGAAYLASNGIGPVLVDRIDDAYDLLEDGEVDAVVYDAPVLRSYASRHGGGEVSTVGGDFETVTYALLIDEDDDEFRESVNLALLDLIENGIHGRLVETWFGDKS